MIKTQFAHPIQAVYRYPTLCRLWVLLLCSAGLGNALLAQKKPELFVLAVGIEQYKDASLNLNFAADDAKDVAAMFKKQTALWTIKSTQTLLDTKATGNGIVQALEGFKKKVTADDYFVFFYSGHGIDGRLVPYDYDGNPYRSTLSKEELLTHLDALGCGYMLFLDACYSGSFAKTETGKNIGVSGANNAPQTEKATKDLVDALSTSDKPYLIFGSSGTHQKSWECKSCKHGYFAQALLWAFENKPIQEGTTAFVPDEDQNGLLSVSELDQYLKEGVRAMTQGEGSPQKVYSRLTMGQEIQLTAFKTKDNATPATASKPLTTGKKHSEAIIDLCIQTNKNYQLGCKDNLPYLHCNGGFLGPADFKQKPLQPNSAPNEGLDFYRHLLTEYQIPLSATVLAVLRLNSDDYMLLTEQGLYWKINCYEQMRWVKRVEFLTYADLKTYSRSADNSYFNLEKKVKKKKYRRQILVKHRDDERGLSAKELKAFLDAL